MIDRIQLWLPEANKTQLSGVSLASTLYVVPVDILLTGELGAGKTSFVQGFMEGLGISDHIASPTYALEQRYSAKSGHEVLHLDLYRLKEVQARELLLATDTHEGIRCIEWADKIGTHAFDSNFIHISFTEKNEGREAHIAFNDMAMPEIDEIMQWRKDVHLPPHIAAHCDAVAEVAKKCADSLIERGRIVRKEALFRAALVHDLFRFVDFKAGKPPEGYKHDPEDRKIWETYQAQYEGENHEGACAQFLRERGFETVAQIVEPHGARHPGQLRRNIEQMLLFYSDKRVFGNKVVSVKERYSDLVARYGEGHAGHRFSELENETLEFQTKFFPDGPPV